MCCGEFCEAVWLFLHTKKQKINVCWNLDRFKQPKGQLVSLLLARMVDMEGKVMS